MILFGEGFGGREFGQQQEYRQDEGVPGKSPQKEIKHQQLQSGQHPADTGKAMGFLPGSFPMLNRPKAESDLRISGAVKEVGPEQNQNEREQAGQEVW